MKRLLKLAYVVAASLASFTLFAATAPETQPDPNAAMVKKTITDFMTKNKIHGVAVEMYVDGVPYTYNFGYANSEKKIPVTQKTIFQLGSISKVMTSILLAQEIDFNNMALADPVKKYVKDLPDNFKNIKLQDLATHTSGLPFNPPKNVTTRDELNKYLMTMAPESQPGQQWVYSNFGIGLLGYALESSTTKDYDKLYRRHILNPLGMVVSTYVPKKMAKFAAEGYDIDDKPTDSYGEQAKLFPAATSVMATADDMQHFLKAAIGLPGTPTRVLYPVRLTQSSFVKLPDRMQGLGWEIHPLNAETVPDLVAVSDYSDLGPIDVEEVFARPTYSGDTLIDKTGTTNGFRAYIAVIPNKKSGIVILANKSMQNNAIVSTGREILFKLAKLTPDVNHA